jgi:hypothetical protein
LGLRRSVAGSVVIIDSGDWFCAGKGGVPANRNDAPVPRFGRFDDVKSYFFLISPKISSATMMTTSTPTEVRRATPSLVKSCGIEETSITEGRQRIAGPKFLLHIEPAQTPRGSTPAGRRRLRRLLASLGKGSFLRQPVDRHSGARM